MAFVAVCNEVQYLGFLYKNWYGSAN